MENWQFPLYVMEDDDDRSLNTLEEAAIALANGAHISGDVILASKKIRDITPGEMADIERRARNFQVK